MQFTLIMVKLINIPKFYEWETHGESDLQIENFE